LHQLAQKKFVQQSQPTRLPLRLPPHLFKRLELGASLEPATWDLELSSLSTLSFRAIHG
jgi:hypothetical protein